MSSHIMSRHTALAAASALLLTVAAGAALADGTSGYSAANAALLRGYTASPGQFDIHNAPHGDPVATKPAATGPAATQRRSVPVRTR